MIVGNHVGDEFMRWDQSPSGSYPSEIGLEQKFWYGTSVALVIVASAPFVLGQLLLIAGGSFGFPVAVGIWLLTLASGCAFGRHVSGTWRAPIVAVAIFGLALLLEYAVVDQTYDGQAYHFDAIIGLSHGWNPFREANPTLDYFKDAASMPPWVGHYPEGSWVASALLASLGLPIEAAKPQNVLILAAVACASFAVARGLGFARRYAALVAAVCAANPVALVQLFSRMNDGLLGGYLALAGIFAALIVLYGAKWAWVGLGLSLILAVNLKFSAVPLAVAVCLTATLFCLVRTNLPTAATFGAKLFVIGCAGIFVFGYHPYVTNVLQHGHPFWPIMGEGSIDIMAVTRPIGFNEISPLDRLVRSYFGLTSTGLDPTTMGMKAPFVVRVSELKMAGLYDIRLAGFGPLFSGAVLLSVVGAGLFAVGRRTSRGAVALLVTGLVWLVASLAMPEAWWARYVPQVWWSIVLIALAGAMAGSRLSRWFGLATLAVLALNATMVLTSTLLRSAQRQREVTAALSVVNGTGGPACLHVGEMHARLERVRTVSSPIQIQQTPMDHCAAATEDEKKLYLIPRACPCP